MTRCASPIGQSLCEHLKFEKVATGFVCAEGEEKTLANVVMGRKNRS